MRSNHICVECGVLLTKEDSNGICWECFLDGGYRHPKEINNKTHDKSEKSETQD